VRLSGSNRHLVEHIVNSVKRDLGIETVKLAKSSAFSRDVRGLCAALAMWTLFACALLLLVTAAFFWPLQIWRSSGRWFCAMQREAFSLDVA
jgi:hypothetical protein